MPRPRPRNRHDRALHRSRDSCTATVSARLRVMRSHRSEREVGARRHACCSSAAGARRTRAEAPPFAREKAAVGGRAPGSSYRLRAGSCGRGVMGDRGDERRGSRGALTPERGTSGGVLAESGSARWRSARSSERAGSGFQGCGSGLARRWPLLPGWSAPVRFLRLPDCRCQAEGAVRLWSAHCQLHSPDEPKQAGSSGAR
jgi:hypothetical protein